MSWINGGSLVCCFFSGKKIDKVNDNSENDFLDKIYREWWGFG